MSTANVRNIIRMPGRLVANPTNLSAAFPYGGTALGIARDMIFNFGVKTAEVTAQEFGNQVTRAIYGGEKPFMAAVLREFDNDALSAVFPNTYVGASSGDRGIKLSPGNNSTNRAGYDLNNKNLKLLFVPNSPLRTKSILIYSAIPAIDPTAQLQLSLAEEIGIAVVFWVGVDIQNRSYDINLAEDLTL